MASTHPLVTTPVATIEVMLLLRRNEVYRRTPERAEPVFRHHDLVRCVTGFDPVVPVRRPGPFRTLALAVATPDECLGERSAQDLFVVRCSHEDDEHAAPPCLGDQNLQALGHGRDVRKVVAQATEQTFPVAEVVLHVDDDQCGGGGVHPRRQSELPALAFGDQPLALDVEGGFRRSLGSIARATPPIFGSIANQSRSRS